MIHKTIKKEKIMYDIKIILCHKIKKNHKNLCYTKKSGINCKASEVDEEKKKTIYYY